MTRSLTAIWSVLQAILVRRYLYTARPGYYATEAEIAHDSGLPMPDVVVALASLEKSQAVCRLGVSDRWTLTDEGEELASDAARRPSLDCGSRSWVEAALCGLLDERRYPGRVALPSGHEGPYGRIGVDEVAILLRSAILAGCSPVRVCRRCGRPEGETGAFAGRHAICN